MPMWLYACLKSMGAANFDQPGFHDTEYLAEEREDPGLPGAAANSVSDGELIPGISQSPSNRAFRAPRPCCSYFANRCVSWISDV